MTFTQVSWDNVAGRGRSTMMAFADTVYEFDNPEKGRPVFVTAEAHPAFESLDRIAIVEMRPPTSPSGIVEPFYRLARSGCAAPLTYQIAQAVLSREPGRALIV